MLIIRCDCDVMGFVEGLWLRKSFQLQSAMTSRVEWAT